MLSSIAENGCKNNTNTIKREEEGMKQENHILFNKWVACSNSIIVGTLVEANLLSKVMKNDKANLLVFKLF